MGFEDIMKEIERTYLVLSVIANSVRSAIIFILSFLLFATVGISWWFSFFPAALCFIVLYNIDSKKDPYKIIEVNYENLADKLSAGRDNQDEKNVFVKDLHDDLRKDLRSTIISSFINAERLKKDFLFFSLMALVIIIISPFNPVLLSIKFDPAKFGLTLEDTNIFNGDGFFGKAGGTEGDDAGGDANKDIFGDKNIAFLGDEDLNVRLALGEDSFDFSQKKKPQTFQFKAVYPDEIGATATESFEENIPKEHQEIVKNYYKKIVEE